MLLAHKSSSIPAVSKREAVRHGLRRPKSLWPSLVLWMVCYALIDSHIRLERKMGEIETKETENMRIEDAIIGLSGSHEDEGIVDAMNGTSSDVSNISSVDTSKHAMMDILSIGSLTKEAFQDAQERTFGSHSSVRHFFRVTEDADSDADCAANLTTVHIADVVNFCRRRRSKDEPSVYSDLRSKLFRPKLDSPGWLCAQKRPIDGLYKLLQRYRDGTDTIPPYVAIIDDDTYLNMDLLSELLTTQYPFTAPQLRTGCLYDFVRPSRLHFPCGGFGSFLSQRSIQRLLQPIDCSSHNGTLESDDPFVRLACWRLNMNLLGEAQFFHNNMSVVDLLYEFSAQQTFARVSEWQTNSGFCLHSDYALAYFFHYYHMGVPDDAVATITAHSNMDDYAWWHRRFGYEALVPDVRRFSNERGECEYVRDHCNQSSTVCHYMEPHHMQALHRNTTAMVHKRLNHAALPRNDIARPVLLGMLGTNDANVSGTKKTSKTGTLANRALDVATAPTTPSAATIATSATSAAPYGPNLPENTIVIDWNGLTAMDQWVESIWKGNRACQTIQKARQRIPLVPWAALPWTHLKMTFDCHELFTESVTGTGNFMLALYMLRNSALLLGNVHVTFTCHDAMSTRTSLIVPWLTGSFTANTTRRDLLVQAVDDTASNTTGAVWARHVSQQQQQEKQACCPYWCTSIVSMRPLMEYELRRMAVALVGARHGPSWSTTIPLGTAAPTVTHGDTIATLHPLWHVPEPTDQRPQPPLIANVELDDAVIHFRCGDLFATNIKTYGFMSFAGYARHISSEARSIGILTQPFAKNQTQDRKLDSNATIKERCRTITLALMEYVQQQHPQAKVSLRNDVEETIALTYARIIMANQSIGAMSTFSVFPIIASFGTGYFLRPTRFEACKWLTPFADENRNNAKQIVLFDEPKLLVGSQAKDLWDTQGKDAVLDWFRT